MKTFFLSVSNALRGLRLAFVAEPHMRIHAFAACIVLVGSIFFGLSFYENIVLLLAIVAVLILELVNTVLERFADAVHPRLHPIIRDIKDMMAGTVLLAVLVAVVIGWMIFYPYIGPMVYDILGSR